MTWKEAVKGDTVRLHVSLDSLLALPEGAVWIEKNGRTEARLGVVRAEKNGGGLRPMVTVEVVSDPLEREVERVTKTVGVVTKAESSRASVDEQDEDGGTMVAEVRPEHDGGSGGGAVCCGVAEDEG